MSKTTGCKCPSIAAVVERAETGNWLLPLIEVATLICVACDVCACSLQDMEVGLLCLCVSCVPLWQKSEISLPCSSWQCLALDTGKKSQCVILPWEEPSRQSFYYFVGPGLLSALVMVLFLTTAAPVGAAGQLPDCVFSWDVEGEWKQWHGRMCSLGSEKCKLK